MRSQLCLPEAQHGEQALFSIPFDRSPPYSRQPPHYPKGITPLIPNTYSFMNGNITLYDGEAAVAN
jgi:hypothetical protein